MEYDDLAADPWMPIKSSNISAVWHDAQKQELRVRFNNGGEWAYPDVSADLFARFMAAESKGAFFAAEIKPVYPGHPYVAAKVNNAPAPVSDPVLALLGPVPVTDKPWKADAAAVVIPQIKAEKPAPVEHAKNKPAHKAHK